MKRKRNASLGCLFWIALILLVLVIFLFNRKRIETVMEATGFVDIIATNSEEPEVEHKARNPEAKPAAETAVTEEKSASAPEKTSDSKPDETVSLTVIPQNTEPPDAAEKTNTSTGAEEKRLRRSTLYFVFHDGSKGELRRVIRPVYYADSPLTDTLKALLEGPSSQELNQNLITLVPRNSAIRSIAVRDGVAYIDMTEAFRFNAFGYEGAELQLKQLIYTATEFPTVDRVQFLIEGVKQQYLNPEGLYIGKPMGREDL